MDRLMDFLNLPGVLPALIGLIAAFGAIVWAVSRRIDASAKRSILEIQRELERVRGENDQTKGLIALLTDLTRSVGELAAAVNKQNETLSAQGAQTTEAIRQVADTHRASIALNEKLATLIGNFQNFSKEQHAMTRGAVGEASQSVIDSVEKGLESTRADIAAVARDVQEVKRIVESLTPCPDELTQKLDRIELKLMRIEQRVPEKPKLDIEPVAPPPDIAPPAADEPKQDIA